MKAAVFLSVIGKSPDSLIKYLSFAQVPNSQKFESIKMRVLRHVHLVNFEVSEQIKTHQLQQKDSQDIRVFILKLQTQTARCNFCHQLRTQLRFLFVFRINSQNLQLPSRYWKCEHHQVMNKLTESTSKNVLSSNASVYQKGHSSTPHKFKTYNEFGSNL